MSPNVGAGGVVVCRALNITHDSRGEPPGAHKTLMEQSVSPPHTHTHTHAQRELKEVLNGAATVTHEIFRFSNMNISYDQHKATYGNMNA